jgi:hypothetical protein
LTVGKIKDRKIKENKELLRVEFELADTNNIRQRQVNDVITLIADISGFADIFMLTAGFLLGNFYHPKSMSSALSRRINRVVLPRSQRRKSKRLREPFL